ncbi:ribonuclease H-like domain-containing protein [Tanacetum coccineum]
MVRSLLITEEMRLKPKALNLPVDSSSPMVLVAEAITNSRSSTSQGKSWKPCFNFAKGSCRFGDSCRYVHDANARVTNTSNGFNKGCGTSDNFTNELLTKLLAQLGNLGIHNGSNTTMSNNVTMNPNVTVPNNVTIATAAPMAFYATQPTRPSVLGLVQAPQSRIRSTGTNLGQATLPPQAFTTGTLYDPTTSAWNIDTVGDGHSIPVTNTGHSILSTPLKSLRLNNVLITPHIVKILIYVCQFVRDNDCTIEFDSFGFSIKDFMTRRVLLRCDSTEDLYPVTTPSPIPSAFLVSQQTWH